MIEVAELAVLSQLTYVAYNRGTDFVHEILTEGSPPFVSRYGQVEFIQAKRLFQADVEGHCCGIIVSNADEVAIAIRGTESLDDYFYDLLTFSSTEEDEVHAGFLMYVENFFEQVKTALDRLDYTTKNIYLTGHSLGGAAALVLLKKLKEDGFNLNADIQAYTFGAPPVSAKEIVLAEKIHHYRNEGDFVPHLPRLIGLLIRRSPLIEQRINQIFPSLLKSLDQYSHNQNEELWMLGYDASLLPDKAEPNLQPIRQLARSLVLQNPLKSFQELRKNDGSKNLLRRIIAAFLEKSTEEHRATLYVSRLFQNQQPPWFASGNSPEELTVLPEDLTIN